MEGVIAAVPTPVNEGGAPLQASVKALVEARTGTPLWRPVLPPFLPLTDDEMMSPKQRLCA